MPGPAGWKPQPDDYKDWIYDAPASLKIEESVDLRKTAHMQHQAFDQLSLDSCTANAIAAALKYGENASAWRNHDVPYNPSRMFIWYFERIMNVTEGGLLDPSELAKVFDSTVTEITTKEGKKYLRAEIVAEIRKDATCEERNGMKALKQYGVCSEDRWVYNGTSYDTMPDGALKEGLDYIDPDFTYWRIKDRGDYKSGGGSKVIADMEAALSEGYPVIFGFWVPEKHDSLNSNGTTTSEWGLDQEFVYNGWLNNGDERWGHAVLAVGYDKAKQRFLVLNSWGEKWGDNGYFWLPYQWFSEKDGMWVETLGQDEIARADDIWVIKSPHSKQVT